MRLSLIRQPQRFPKQQACQRKSIIGTQAYDLTNCHQTVVKPFYVALVGVSAKTPCRNLPLPSSSRLPREVLR
ncbi:hypothetical protein BQ8794_40025 [Mesorhizobium prunaredense]|uniref:Uncharacterized protein n=1 Tax=Mesorhizobium prunaredense TaxID=1631249 RepID=A0A1R3VC10_9HYPH|nr:hypothetical protein BQ8794_40025 [Mesorhizobium prunaredense]